MAFRPSRATALWLLLTTSVLTHAAMIAIVTKLATTVLPQTAIHDVAIAAVVMNLIELVMLFGAVALLARVVSQDSGRLRFAFDIAAILIFVSSILLAIYTLSWTWTQDHHQSKYDQYRTLTAAGLGLWALDIALQSPLYVLWIWPWTRPKAASVEEERQAEPRASPARSMKRSMSVRLAALAPPPPPLFKMSSASSPASPTYAPSFTTTSTRRSSLRDSMSYVVKPVTSRTKLLLSPAALASRESRSIYSERARSSDTDRRDDGFGSWDTSDVEERCDSAMMQKPTRTKLETIPQSRPVSPAKPLDGPFDEFDPEDVPLPDSPLSPTSPMSPVSDTRDSLHSPTMPHARRESDQLHIHPLFRTNTPSPTPPLVSPGTTITASPYAGQVFNPTSYGHMSDSPVALIPILSRVSSYKSLKRSETPNGDGYDVPALPLNRPDSPYTNG